MSTQYELVVQNGEVCLPSGRFMADLAVDKGKVAAVARPGEVAGLSTLDVRGLTILPGIVHTHVHMREPGLEYKEDYESGTKTAATGGVTCTIDMPNVTPPTTTVERYLEKKELAAAKAYVDYQHWPAPSNPEEVHRLAKLGIVPGLKEFMVRDPKAQYPHLPELAMAHHGQLFKVMRAAAEAGLNMLVHGADPDLMHTMAEPFLSDGHYSARHRAYDFNGWWFASRDIGSQVAILLARLAGLKIHVLHMGNGRHTHTFVRRAKEEGQNLTAEMEGPGSSRYRATPRSGAGSRSATTSRSVPTPRSCGRRSTTGRRTCCRWSTPRTGSRRRCPGNTISGTARPGCLPSKTCCPFS